MSRRRLLKRMAIPFTLGLAALVIYGYIDWQKEYRRPSKMGGGDSYSRDREYQRYECKVWTTASDELYYAVCAGYNDFEPTVPSVRFEYRYDIDVGGTLSVNGSAVPYYAGSEKRLLAADPFGTMQEITLADREADLVASGNAESIWEEVVLRRLHRQTGKMEDGQRVGDWIFRSISGATAVEGSYVDGKRDGQWTYYYPSGTVRARIEYVDGRRHGKWRHYSDEGRETETLTWKNDIPVDRPVTQIGFLGHIDKLLPNGNSSHTSGI